MPVRQSRMSSRYNPLTCSIVIDWSMAQDSAAAYWMIARCDSLVAGSGISAVVVSMLRWY